MAVRISFESAGHVSINADNSGCSWMICAKNDGKSFSEVFVSTLFLRGLPFSPLGFVNQGLSV